MRSITFLIGLLAIACSSSSESPPHTGAGSSSRGGKSQTSTSAVRGSKADRNAPDAGDSAPAPVTESGEPLTFVMKGHVDAGGEIQNCMYIQLPMDATTAVFRAESHYSPGSHHFLVYRQGQVDLGPEDTTEHLCSPAEEGGNFKPTYYEAQAPDSVRALPPGVAHVFQPGEVLLLTSHYLNTTEKDLDTEVTFILHTMRAEDVEQEAGSIFFYNPTISIPPSSSVTTTRTCPIGADINLALLWSHMHSRGVDFMATTDDSSASDAAGALYETTEWSEPSPRAFAYNPPVTLHAGSSITYACTFQNQSDTTIVQGLSARTNEMCILHGMYWPRTDAQTEACLMGQSASSDPAPIP